MRHFKILFLAVLLFMTFCSEAYPTKYIGTELLGGFHKDNGTTTRMVPCFSVFTGVKVHEKLIFEFGGYHSTKLVASDVSITKRSIYGTVLADIPVCCNLSFKFGMGLSQYMPTTQDKGKLKKMHYKLVPRFCTGFGFDIVKDVEGRVGIIAEGASLLENAHKTFKNDNIHLNIGISYNL